MRTIGILMKMEVAFCWSLCVCREMQHTVEVNNSEKEEPGESWSAGLEICVSDVSGLLILIHTFKQMSCLCSHPFCSAFL